MINQIAGKVLEKCFFSLFIFPDLEIIWKMQVHWLEPCFYFLAGIFFESSIESTGLTYISSEYIMRNGGGDGQANNMEDASALVGTLLLYLLAGIFFET